MLCEILKIASLLVRNWYYWYMTRVMFPYSVLTNSLVYRYYLISYANWTIVPRDSVTPLFPLHIISQLVALYARWIQMFESHLSVYNIDNIFDVARGYYICIRESLCITSQSVIEISDWMRWQNDGYLCLLNDTMTLLIYSEMKYSQVISCDAADL